MKFKFLALVFTLFSFSFHVTAQIATISNTTSSGSFFISGSNPVIFNITGTATIAIAAIQNYLNVGTTVIISAESSTTADISVLSSIISSGAGDLILKASRNIQVNASLTLQTNSGDVILWSDADNNALGAIDLKDNITINTANGLTTSNLSGGGKIILAGGSDNGDNDGVATDGIPDGYASTNVTSGIWLGTNTGSHTQFYSGGGDVVINGKSTTSSGSTYAVGVYSLGILTINSGNGSIRINGSSATFYGINFVHPSSNTPSGAKHLVLISNKASGSAIKITGTSTTNYGVVFNYQNPKDILATGGGDIQIIGVSGSTSFYGVFLQNLDILATTGNINLDGGVNGLTFIDYGTTFGSKTGSAITSSTSNVVISTDRINVAVASTVRTTGGFTYQPSSSSFPSVLSWPVSSNLTYSNISALVLGKPSNTTGITLASNLSIAGDVDIYAGTITLNNNLTTSNNGDISFYTNNALGGLTAQRNVTAAGVFSYIPQANSFGAAVTFPITNLNLLSAGLLIGKTTNTADITVSGTTTLSGPVTLYGGNINIDQSINTTGGVALGDVLCKASGNIVLAASRSITTSGGDVILWANSDNANSAGSVALRSLSSIVTGSNSVTGGHVWIGGGSNGGSWNGLAVGAGYAVPGTGFNPPTGVGGWTAGVFFESCSITTFGGDVKILGDAASSGRGLICFGTVSIQTNAGDIEIEANATNSALANVNGILFGLHDNLTIGNVSLSSSASGAAITVSGFGRGTENAIGLSGTLTALSTGTGNIVFNGTSYGTATAIKVGNFYHGILNTYAASGSITFNGGTKGLEVASAINTTGLTSGPSKLNIGQGGTIASSTSAVVLTGDALNVGANGIAVNTSGPLTIQPSSNSFTNALTYPITSLVVANTITGLTLGKSTNTANITVGAATTINGPITLHGGALNLNANLTTTSTNSTASNISLNGTTISGTPTLTLAQGSTLTMNLSSNTNFAGPIVGTNLGFVKNGAGTLTLTAATALNFIDFTISGGTYRLNSNQQLTLSNSLTNNGTFLMKSGATFVPSATVTNVAGTGTFTVEKLLTGNESNWNTSTNNGRFWYMGIPVNSAPRTSFGSHNATSNRLFSYSETTKTYTSLDDNAPSLSGGTGYVHRRTTNDTLTFTGVGANGLRGAEFTQNNMTRTSGASVGFHLVSNPYMAYVDWNAVTKTNIESTYYIRSAASGNISALISYNSVGPNYVNGGVSTITNIDHVRYISPMQAFWVRVGSTSTTGSLGMNTGMLTHQTTNPGLKTSTIFPTSARVNLVDGLRFDQTLVFMNQDMVNGVDAYDSEKMFVSGNPQIYTMAAGKKLVMNGLNSNKKKISVPLYLELPESKVYNLQLAEYQLEDGLILLEDKQEGTIQDFTIHDTYAFYANSGVLQNRFVLHFYAPDNGITAQGPSNSWVAEEASYTEGGNILISSDSKGKVQISLDQPETEKVEGTVQATDANGRVVYSAALEGLTTEFQLNMPTGIYYLTVQSGTIIENKKVFIQE